MMVGIILGVIIGVLPGLGGANGVAILLPLTFSMNPTSAIIMLSCIYWEPCSKDVESRRTDHGSRDVDRRRDGRRRQGSQ